ncbi:LpxI family protein [Dissulfurirhabdus thermomarina]|uniref:LpxI family protein n=1 Tax=Dissulfurirhabdus thermomarina TaxID=1765737 RepID=A0A6N9TTM5_DISTH|nr:UDP-2,3-diacylglucosamine diphosphatase LpxI [Dissulfurirhabdus thermomarina]NDY42787.1 LpxI family protein [Dissulfurirhabdus thermomarina]NMX23559.1 LpxI family protein [Dissulfurirhabdus thermomarina]
MKKNRSETGAACDGTPPAAGAGPLGLVAGGGQFPLLCARAARARGREVVAVAHRGETDPALADEVSRIEWVHLGQLGRLLRFLREAGAREVQFAGTITKKRIFRDVRPDLRALNLWNRIDRRLDDGILRAVADELAAEGIEVVPSTLYLEDLLAPAGVLTRRRPTREQWDDIRFGWNIAKEIGRLDIGQCLVVKDRAVLAVEAIEGTDETIRRGGRLAHGGAVVVKILKPGQDTRFDLPALGLRTVETMAEVKAAVLALEAGRALFFDRRAVVQRADRLGIVIVGLKGDEWT